MKRILVGALCGAALAATAAPPTQFDMRSPQGFETPAIVMSVAQARDAVDGTRVQLRGKITEHLRADKYTFVDEHGDSVMVSLDSDRDWSNISRNEPIEIEAKVDRFWNSFKLEVKKARPQNPTRTSTGKPQP